MRVLKKVLLLVSLATVILTGCTPSSSESSNPPNSDLSSSEPSSSLISSEPPSSESTTIPDSSEPSSEQSIPPSVSENPSIITYEISWFDENGDLLAKNNVPEGALPSYSYVVTNTDSHIREFIGWSKTLGGAVITIAVASEATSYYAIVRESLREFTVTFNSNGGSAIDPIIVEYGTILSEPEKPTLDDHNFVGWTFDVELKNSVVWPLTVVSNLTLHAAWNERSGFLGILETLLSGYALNPYEYIPEAMQPYYADNLVDFSDVEHDYSAFVNTSSIATGFGEQWAMVIENLNESMVFFNAIAVVEGITATSVSVFNDYLDKNPQSFARHEFSVGNYEVVIFYEDDVLFYALNYEVTLPVIGHVTAEIALSLNLETNERTGRIQLGDANALRYVINENSYTFAIRYLGLRRAFFHIERDDDDNVAGHIYETLGIEGKFTTISAAEFFVIDDYVSVVGNKARAIPGFTGTINELYNKNEGKLLGYEIRETATISLVKVTFNTLWFNLGDTNGINNIKHAPNDKDEQKFYVNNSPSPFATKNVGGLSLKTASRRFDLEMRQQFFTSYNVETEEYAIKAVDTPMIFVQEEMLGTFVADVKSENSGLTLFALTINLQSLEKIRLDYSVLIDVFITFKETLNIEQILSFIGEPILGTKD